MKRAGWCVSVLILLIISGPSAYALDTVPSSEIEPKTTGPLNITNYSFSGHSLRYIQLYNTSDNLVDLSGWRVVVEQGSIQHVQIPLTGLIEPDKYVTVANVSFLPSATFTFQDVIPAADPVLTSISLLPPLTSGYMNETVSPTISSSTPRVAGTPATFYFSRNVSASTGNYLTTFSAFVPASNYVLASDPLYRPYETAGLRIVEVYPDPLICSPFELMPTCADYVKLQNVSAAAIDTSKLRLRTGLYGSSPTSTNTFRLEGVVDAGHFIIGPISLSSSGAWVWLEDAYGRLRYDTSLVQYPSSAGHAAEAWAYDERSDTWRWSMYPTPGDNVNYFGPDVVINRCQGLAISEIAANVAMEDQFIELVNLAAGPIDISGCILQTNRSITKQVVLDGTLLPQEHKAIYVRDTELTLTKTTEGTVYVVSSDGATEVDHVTYDNQTENTAWVLIDGSWQRTYQMSPGMTNVLLESLPCGEGEVRNNETGFCNKIRSDSGQLNDCGEGKYRSPETNRCRTIEMAAELSACGAGEYRSSETNRCRSLVSAASVLTPCAANQERNPETNRCRSVQAAAELTPCSPTQERNPETNRCRNKAGAAAADFPIETIAEPGEATIGWWAFGGVGTLAVGYAGWEWRRELVALIKKCSIFGIGRS